MDSNVLGSMLGYMVVVLIVLTVIFLVLREFVCWYWKINQRVALLIEIRDLLATSKSISYPSYQLPPSRNELASAPEASSSPPPSEYIPKLLALGCKVTQLNDREWDIQFPSGSMDRARSIDELEKIAKWYIDTQHTGDNA